MVDTFYDLGRTRQLMDLYGTVLDGPPRRLLNTHHNGDHCWGNQLFAEVGTEIMGHRRCAEWFTREATPELFVALCEADDVAPAFAALTEALRAFDFHDIVLTPPTTLLDGDTVLDLGGRPAPSALRGAGPHAGRHGAAPARRRRGVHRRHPVPPCTPLGWEGTFANWIAALRRIEALGAGRRRPRSRAAGRRRRAPGPTGVSRVRARRDPPEHFDAGRTSLEAAERIDLGPYGLWTEPERLAFQVDRAYREFAGVPWDEPIDTTRVFTEMAILRAGHATP